MERQKQEIERAHAIFAIVSRAFGTSDQNGVS